MNERDVIRTAELSEVNANADLYAAAPPEVRDALGLSTAWIGEAFVLTARRLDAVMLNRAIAVGLDQPVSDTTLDALVHHFESAGINNWTVQLTPAAQPADLGARLNGRSLRTADNWSKVLRDDTPPREVATDLRIAPAGPEDAETYAAVVCDAFGIPPFAHPWLGALVGRPGWHHYLAWDGDQAAGAGTLFVAGENGWLSFGATRSAFRRRGSQGAIMARRLRDGIALGCRRFFSEAEEDTPDHPNPSFHNLSRTGFSLLYQRRNYLPPTCP